MKKLLLVFVVAGCRTIAPDPARLGETPACVPAFEDARRAYAWQSAGAIVGEAGGAVLAVAGPAVALAGIALDDQPATPPVEAFVAGGALTVAGVASVVIGGALADQSATTSARAQRAYAGDCRG